MTRSFPAPKSLSLQRLLAVGSLLTVSNAALAQSTFDTVTFHSSAQDVASFNGLTIFPGSEAADIATRDGTPRSSIPCARLTEYHPKHVPGRVRVTGDLYVFGSTIPNEFGATPGDPNGDPRLFTIILQGWNAADESVVLARKDINGRSAGMKAERFGSGVSTNFSPVDRYLKFDVSADITSPVFNVYASICDLTQNLYDLAVVSADVEIATPQ